MARGGINPNYGSAMDEDDDTIKVTETLGDCSLKGSDDRYSELEIFKKPGCLIYTDDKGLLQINLEVLNQLSKIESKISVVGVCGLYRTGKSYLMNCLAGEKTGFNLGNTTQSETKGIWLWGKDLPEKQNQVLLLLDTEGLDDLEKGDPQHDNKLFCLTLLICSTLIINVKGTLDYTALGKLACIATLSDSIKILSQDDKESNSKNIPIASPQLVMCIRDFFLKAEKNGKTLTPDEYLVDSLQDSTKLGPIHEQYNNIKQSIKKFFPERKCFTMAQPATGEHLQEIESLGKDSLSPRFVKDVATFKEYIYDREPKVICHASKKAIDGADLASLVTSYVDALRNDSPIQLEDAFSQACIQRNKRVLEKVMNAFKKEMSKGKNLKNKRKLHDMFIRLFDKVMAKYREESMMYNQDYYENMVMDNMQSHHRSIQDEIQKTCKNKGTKVLSTLYENMLTKNGSTYIMADGHLKYEADMMTLEKEFMSKMKDYDADDIQSCLIEFKSTTMDDQMMLFSAATRKSDEEKYSKEHEEITSALSARMEMILQSELEKRNKHLEDELEILRQSYNELYKKLKPTSCSIM